MTFGALAQLVERRLCKAEVRSSILLSSTKKYRARLTTGQFPSGEVVPRRFIATAVAGVRPVGGLETRGLDVWRDDSIWCLGKPE